MRNGLGLTLLVISNLLFAPPASAQDPPSSTSASHADPQVDQNVFNLPTTASLRHFKSYFRITHRFARDLEAGDFGSLAADLFSLDNGAVIGLEYRFGITDAIQAGIHRNSLAKTLQVFGRWDAVRQGSFPLAISPFGSVEGLDNMTEGRQPAVGAVLSWTRGRAVALYATPMFVDGTRAAELLGGDAPSHDHDHGIVEAMDLADTHDGEDHADHDGTTFLGLGGRVRVLSSVFVSGEVSPRLAGHDPGETSWAVALEKTTRGHVLALALTNTFGTTPGQLARGGEGLHLGFNVSRKF